MPEFITREQAELSEPMVYQLGARESWTLLAASCIYDGTALLGDFIPAMAIYSPNNLRLLVLGLDLLVKQGGGPQVSFAPHLSPATPNVASVETVLQTGMPQLEFLPGMIIAFGGFGPTGGFSDPAIQLYSMMLYVDAVSGRVGSGSFRAFSPLLLHQP